MTPSEITTYEEFTEVLRSDRYQIHEIMNALDERPEEMPRALWMHLRHQCRMLECDYCPADADPVPRHATLSLPNGLTICNDCGAGYRKLTTDGEGPVSSIELTRRALRGLQAEHHLREMHR